MRSGEGEERQNPSVRLQTKSAAEGSREKKQGEAGSRRKESGEGKKRSPPRSEDLLLRQLKDKRQVLWGVMGISANIA